MTKVLTRLRHQNAHLTEVLADLRVRLREKSKAYMELKRSIEPMRRELDALRGPLPNLTPRAEEKHDGN